MRLLLLAILATVAAPVAAAPATPVKVPKAPAGAICERTTSHYAGRGSIYRGDRIAPKKLTELPPAIGYMAVLRHVGGCEIPMTIIEYRTGRRP